MSWGGREVTRGVGHLRCTADDCGAGDVDWKFKVVQGSGGGSVHLGWSYTWCQVAVLQHFGVQVVRGSVAVIAPAVAVGEW